MTQKNLYKDSPIASISFYKECLLPRYELMIILVFNKHDKVKKSVSHLRYINSIW